MSKPASTIRPVMGIGACLAGKAVRYNGQTKSANNPNTYIDSQVFMAPYPDELKLRNLL